MACFRAVHRISEPADRGHDRLERAEGEGDPQNFGAEEPFRGGTVTHRHGERVRRYTKSEKK